LLAIVSVINCPAGLSLLQGIVDLKATTLFVWVAVGVSEMVTAARSVGVGVLVRVGLVVGAGALVAVAAEVLRVATVGVIGAGDVLVGAVLGVADATSTTCTLASCAGVA
jgi:hypothetical protein